MDEAFERWATAREDDVAAGLLRAGILDEYRYKWRIYVKGSKLGRRRVSSVDKKAIQAHYKQMLKDGKRIGTVETAHSLVSQVMGFATEQGWCKRNSARGACTEISRAARAREGASGANDQVRCLTPQGKVALLAALDEGSLPSFRHYAPIVRLMLHTGLRIGEVSGLCEEDVDSDEIRVRRSLRYAVDADGHMHYLCNDPKSASSRRDLPLSAAARADLTDWRMLGARCQEEPCGVKGLVFCRARGGALCYEAVNGALHKAARRANELAGRVVVPEGVTCHWLRHTFVTEAIESGMPIAAVSRYVGHDDIRVTMDVYYACRKEYMRASVAMLDGIEAYASRQARSLGLLSPDGAETSHARTKNRTNFAKQNR